MSKPVNTKFAKAGRYAVIAIAVAAPVAFLAIFFLWPVVKMIAMGVVGTGIGSTSLADVLSRRRIWQVLGMTVYMAIGGTLGSVILGVPGAYVLYRLKLPCQSWLRAFVTIPFVLPVMAVAVGFSSLFGSGAPLSSWGLMGTKTLVIAAMVFFNYSLVVRVVGPLWAGLDPRAEEAAAVLGANPTRVFLTVTLPRLVPAICSAASMVFLFCASAYALVQILGGPGATTLEAEIYNETVAYMDYRAAAVLSIMQLIVVVCALTISEMLRSRVERRHKVAVTPRPKPVRVADLPAIFITAVTVVFLLGAPLVGLVVRSLQRGGHWTIQNFLDLGDPGAASVLETSVLNSLFISFSTALAATAIAIAVGLTLSVVLSRRPKNRYAKQAVKILDVLFMLPLGVSAVTVGFGFLVTLSGSPLKLATSWWLVPIAQAIVAIPMVARTVLPAMRAIDPRQREAASALGASPSRVLATIDGPYLLRTGVVAAGFAFAISMGEFGATSFLARPATATLPVAIYTLASRPGATEQGMAMAASVLLASVTAVIMIIVERLRPPNAVLM